MILLLGKEKSFLVDESQKDFSCEFGKIEIKKARLGKKIKTNKGHEFLVLKPTISDSLAKCKRMPQVVTPKDAAQVIAQTGLESGWHCMDAGGGSGFLSIFIANIAKPGPVAVYEKRNEFIKNLLRNVKICGLENVKVKNKPVEKFTEKNLDLITLDMPDAEKMVKKCHDRLKPGGWLCIYSPHVEQQIECRKAMEKSGFIRLKTVETIQRSWRSAHGFTHPVHSQIVHTGFLTFARKF